MKSTNKKRDLKRVDKDSSDIKELDLNVEESTTPDSTFDLNTLDPILKHTIEDLLKIWKETRNPNAFIFSCYLINNPHFITDEVTRGSKIKLHSNLRKSLLDRLVGKLMNNNKKTAGKKIKTLNLISKTLEKEKEQYTTLSRYLLLCLVKSVPNYDIRRQKYGSGFLTKAVRLTIARKISWFISTLFNHVKSKRPRNSLIKILATEFSDLMSNSTRSALLTKKRECEQNAIKSNIQ